MIRRAAARWAAVALSTAAFAAAVFGVLGAGPAQAAGRNVGPVVAFMRAQVGKRYVWGGNGPNVWDCSGVVKAAYATVGVDLPRTTFDQVNVPQRVPLAQVQPGDLLFSPGSDGTVSNPGHVGMYVGAGQVIDARGVNYGVIVSALSSWTQVVAVVRPTGSADSIETMIVKAAAKEGFPAALLHAQLVQESGLNPHAVSPVGAQGIAQFMPDTWATWGRGGDVWNPKDAIPTAARFDAALLRANGGDVGRALAAYNAGQDAVDRFGGVPPPSFADGQTYNYVRSIEAMSGVSGVLALHPQTVSAPLPVRILKPTVAIPTVPQSTAQFVHDVGMGAVYLYLMALGIRKTAPYLLRNVRNPLLRAVLSTLLGSRKRKPKVCRRSRKPPRKPKVRVVSQPRGSARSATAPQGSARGPQGVRKGSAPPGLGAAIMGFLFASARGKPRNMQSAPNAPNGWAPQPPQPPRNSTSGSAPPRQAPQPPPPRSAPPPRTPAPPPPQGAPMKFRVTSPDIDIDWEATLDDPGFSQLLLAAKGFEEIDLSDGPKAIATVVFLDKLATSLSEAAEHVAGEIWRRNFSDDVRQAMSEAAQDLANAADGYRTVGHALESEYGGFFHLRVSKPVEPIGA
jgi:cell wall-associated NlpC family hydrolase